MKKTGNTLKSPQERDWLGKEPVDSSIFDSGDDVGPGKPLSFETTPLGSTKDDSGYDPYNTGRFINNKG